MQKKGQIALYIITGIVILLIVSVFFYFKSISSKSLFSNTATETISVPKELAGINTFIDKCFKDTSNQAVYQIARNGGYYIVPKDRSIIWFDEEVPYYYLNKNISVPSISLIEKSISSYIKLNIKTCLNFTDFKNQGISIKEGSTSVSTKINNKNIEIKMNYPVTIKKGSIETILKDFTITIKSNLYSQNKAAVELMQQYSKKPGYLCLNCISDISKNNNVSVDTLPVSDVSGANNDIIWFLIDDTEYKVNNKTITLRFVVEQ